MNFCNECGADLRQQVGAKFCHNCGKPLRFEAGAKSFPDKSPEVNYSINSSWQPSSAEKSGFNGNYNSYGIIYTNLNALAYKLDCSQNEVKSIIQDYIFQLEKCGHQYILLDAGNNSYKNLSTDHGWQSHIELLNGFRNDNSEAEFLFILGGHDVIPMAIIDNEPMCYEDDLDIETDLPYSYLLSENFEELLWNGSLFKKDIILYCGRLPTAFGCSLENIQNYLEQLTPLQKIAYEIAKDHLKTSFDITRSNGFNEWLSSQKK